MMGGFKRTEPSAYLVAWPDLTIKAGRTERQRWRRFLLRGGVLRHVVFSDSDAAMSSTEDAMHAELRALLPFAFDSTADAADHLGVDGGGYRECYRAASAAEFEHAIASCVRIMQTHRANELRTSMPHPYAVTRYTDVRTDEQTETVAYVTDRASLTDTCAHVRDADDVEIDRTAERKEKPVREPRDPAAVIQSHLEEKSA